MIPRLFILTILVALATANSRPAVWANGLFVERIVFTSDRDGNNEIYVTNVDGTHVQRLTFDPDSDQEPTWCHDGSRIAFVSGRGGNVDIYVMDADGSNLTRITSHPANDSSPAWSPDCSQLAFQSRRFSGSGPPSTFVVDVSGGCCEIGLDEVMLGTVTTGGWSPDGEELTFQADLADKGLGGPNNEIFVIELASGIETRLTFRNRNEAQPTWSHSGEFIALQCDAGEAGDPRDPAFINRPDICVLERSNPSNFQRLTTEAPGITSSAPAWSPDDSRILFTSGKSGTLQLYAVRSDDGTAEEQLTTGPANNFDADWSKVPLILEAQTLYLHGIGPNANPPVLTADSTVPAVPTEKYRDSASLNYSGGNIAKEIGTWLVSPNLQAGSLVSLGDLDVWIGLKNSDDQGTFFDLITEVYKDNTLIASGLTRCIQGVTRNPSFAKEAFVPFDSIEAVDFDGSEALTLRIKTRIGTNVDGTKCGGHNNAVGLRLYFDSNDRPSSFELTMAQQ